MIPLYISHATPHTVAQETFLDRFKKKLAENGMLCENIYVSEPENLLDLIKQKIRASEGIVSLAFERRFLESAVNRRASDIEGIRPEPLSRVAEMTPYIQIETAIAIAYDLPVMTFKEKGLLPDGIFSTWYYGVEGPDFDIGDSSFFDSGPFNDAVASFRELILKNR